MVVLVCGSRDWTDDQAIFKRLSKLPDGTTVIHGACSGADSLAGKIAKKLGLVVKEFPANWTKYDKAAGPIRNSEMLSYGVDLVLAFHCDITKSKGTLDMVNKAKKAGVPVIVFKN